MTKNWMIVLSLSLLFSSPAFSKTTPILLTRYVAKEYCSCRFIVGQTPKVCKDENKATNILVRVREDKKNKVIHVTNIFTKATAQFVSDNHGCILVENEKSEKPTLN